MKTEQIYPLIAAALLGVGGGTGAGTLFSDHGHPRIIAEIRKVQYEEAVYKLNVKIAVLEDTGQKDTADYAVAVAQVIKFNEMLVELGK